MLRSHESTSFFVPLLVAALLALALLATLQYHWVGQVSAGDLERRQANLTVSARHFSEDFNRELARAYLSFQMDAQTLRDKQWSRFDQRYDRWMASAPFPGLVKAIYLVEVNQIGRIKLSHYKPEAGRFENESSWPFTMIGLRRRFERAYRHIFAQGDEARITMGAVDRDGPALLVPIARPWLLSGQQDDSVDADIIFSDLIFSGTINRCVRCPPEMFDTPLLAHTIVVLDRDYLLNTVLPSLAERYFPRSGGSDYYIGVIDSSDPRELVFSSDTRMSATSFSGADARLAIFDISYEDVNALLLASDPRMDTGTTPADRTGERIAIGVLGHTGESPDANNTPPGLWELVLKHRAGSLDAAVSELRLRNMLVSFSTLLLLGGSVAMVLISTRRAQRLAQQQIEFASTVSHELRTPLAVICSAGENLADGLINDLQKARQYGSVILHEGRRLTDMVEQVLAFAGVQSGRQQYAMSEVVVGDLVESALQPLHHQIREGGYRLELQVEAQLPLLRADPTALRRSVQNLVSNAMKYGGTARWIGVHVARDDAGICISVSDRGIGIEPDELPHIFEPFYRGRQASTMQAHGSGLGLSMVRHVMEAHGGRVSAESLPHAGTCISIHLPIVPQRTPALEKAASHA